MIAVVVRAGDSPGRAAFCGVALIGRPMHTSVGDNELSAVALGAESHPILVSVICRYPCPRGTQTARPWAPFPGDGLAEDAIAGPKINVEMIRIAVARPVRGHPGA